MMTIFGCSTLTTDEKEIVEDINAIKKDLLVPDSLDIRSIIVKTNNARVTHNVAFSVVAENKYGGISGSDIIVQRVEDGHRSIVYSDPDIFLSNKKSVDPATANLRFSSFNTQMYENPDQYEVIDVDRFKKYF